MPRKPPPRPDPLSPAGIRLTVIRKLVSADALKIKGAWGREIHILTRLQKRFPEDSFWLSLQPAQKLDTLAYFIAPFGAAQLQQEWNAYQFNRAQDRLSAQSDIDRASILSMMMDEAATDTAGVPQEPLKKKVSPLEWADS